MPKELTKVKELLYWSYANLAMAHYAVEEKLKEYNTTCYSLRARLYKGFLEERLRIGSLFDDEKIKLKTSGICCYCGAKKELSLDHIFPRYSGGLDTGDNLIYSCRKCNSSKGKKDLLEWTKTKNTDLPVLILRRYIKLVILYCNKNNLLDKKIEELADTDLPFNLKLIPRKLPKPENLILFHNIAKT
jgi:hypothetical protein